MKTLLLSAGLVLASLSVQAQVWKNPLPIDSSTHKVAYAAVVAVAGATQAELYTRARTWFATEFKAANSVLQMDDKEAGQLIGKGNTIISFRASGLVVQPVMSFRLNVQVKEGRYRYNLTDIASEAGGATLGPTQYVSVPVETRIGNKDHYDRKGRIKPGVEAYYTALDAELKSIAARLEAAMRSGSQQDW